MILFHNDYNQTCHPRILNRMLQINNQQMDGYGVDACSEHARALICKICGRKDLAVHFLVGGTQTNLTVIDAALRPHQAVLCPVYGHINTHETGAVEATGHKVLPLECCSGKISAEQIEAVMCAHNQDPNREHTVQPKMVYISNPTEFGTIYTYNELEAISKICKKYGMYLFVDGARLGYALEASGNDITLADLAELTDVFYIGGTKVGAMFGEAVVISNPALALDFRYLIKQHGAMLAKGWLLGVQFEVLFEDGLYMELSRHANKMADKIRSVLSRCNCPMLIEGTTNQIFPILPDPVLNDLKDHFTFSEQERIDEEHRAVRFCTSWSTEEKDVDELCAILDISLKEHQ